MLNPKLFIVSANEVSQYPKLVGYNNGAVVKLADLPKNRSKTFNRKILVVRSWANDYHLRGHQIHTRKFYLAIDVWFTVVATPLTES